MLWCANISTQMFYECYVKCNIVWVFVHSIYCGFIFLFSPAIKFLPKPIVLLPDKTSTGDTARHVLTETRWCVIPTGFFHHLCNIHWLRPFSCCYFFFLRGNKIARAESTHSLVFCDPQNSNTVKLESVCALVEVHLYTSHTRTNTQMRSNCELLSGLTSWCCLHFIYNCH